MSIRLCVAGAVFCALAACSAGPAPAASTGDPVTDAINTSRGFSGQVLVAEGDDITFNQAFGETSSGRALTTDEIWRWASVTKQIVAVAIMDAVDEGSLALDARVSDILPGYFEDGGSDVTVQHLLQHTSGLGDPFDLSASEFRTLSQSGKSPAEICLSVPAGTPSERFNYNNCDFIVAGTVLEAIDGGTWFESIQARVLEPAGIDKVYFNDPDMAETVPAPRSLQGGMTLADYGASGALYGPASSLLAFDRALLEGEFLSDVVRATLWTGKPEFGFVALGQWSFSAPLEGCDGAVRIIERRGDVGGIQARNILLPEKNISVIVFTNNARFDFGEIWTGSGFSHDLLSAAACSS